MAAATELARHRIGALIAFEQDANLDEFVVGQGTAIDAAVQRELLVGLFVPESLNKLHDGAVVIRNLRIAKAGVFFPMPDTKVLDKSLGSRHRAALGITEETDAVVVVVSEERGSISFCFNGNIVTNLDGASLRQALLGLFGQRGAGSARQDAGQARPGHGHPDGDGELPRHACRRRARRARSGVGRDAAGPPAVEGTGSAMLAPPAARRAAAQEREGAREAPPSRSPDPMAPAKPIETPKPVAARRHPDAAPRRTEPWRSTSASGSARS